MTSWKYDNHRVSPKGAPHLECDTEYIDSGRVWKDYPNALLASYVTDFDCGKETDFWYVIIDKPFDLSELKAKRRYEITKGLRNFRIEVENNPLPKAEELYQTYLASLEGYASENVTVTSKDSFVKFLSIMGKDTNELTGGGISYL